MRAVRSQPEIYLALEIVCTGRLWFKNFHPNPEKDAHLCRIISCDLLRTRIQRIWAYVLGCA